ncbi:hypothetical protein BOTBODRAFT_49175 [Botryobasidium botryosum FD-172 SS1]|uniref:Large ribosomal subunit protein uL29m n=1 Tax=Botryobasidium botryosum (strain FD-172 SS1) TaxID=930990 RepID=A0A067M5E7_BOTB1|nr:hypothetical protein BOTBODRAFT_49175 [Botryobasidium botryosum FD-172 SS1]
MQSLLRPRSTISHAPFRATLTARVLTRSLATTTTTTTTTSTPQVQDTVSLTPRTSLEPLEPSSSEGVEEEEKGPAPWRKAPSATPQKNNPPGPLRPNHRVPVDPNHGLWAFFRKVQESNSGEVYRALTPSNRRLDRSGRSWTAAELRRKSFKDLHTLWYVLLRERNLLATQKHEAMRLGADYGRHTSIIPRTHRVSKSMARIKGVLNERRLAYEAAVELYRTQPQGEGIPVLENIYEELSEVEVEPEVKVEVKDEKLA